MALAHSPKIVTDGLLMCLDAANIKSYPGSGTTWFDLSKNGLNGTLTNGPTFNTTEGGAFTFDGVNDYVDLALNSQTHSVFGDAPFSFLIWFKLSQFGSSGNACNDNRALIIGRNNVSNDYNVLGTYTTSTSASMIGFSGSTGALTLNKYCCFAGVRNKSAETFQAYRDGLITGTQNTTGIVRTNPNQSITIGGGHSIGCGASTYMYGDVALVLAYNRPLTSDEVLQNFSAHRGRFGI